MRVQCDVCEKAVAEVVCCADEAALCLSCDQRVHAANKLASKHQRLRLLHNHPNDSNPPLPLCDICQEKGAIIFCLEDRALVCRNCDVCIHAANSLAAGHKRFLATGVQVALESEQHDADSDTHSSKPEAPCPQPPVNGTNVTSSSTSTSTLPSPSIQKSPKDLDLTDLVSNYPLADLEFSKTDLMPFCDHDWLTDLSVFDDHVYTNSLPEVPQAPFSIYTASTQELESGAKGKLRRDAMRCILDLDDVSVVPDLTFLPSHAPPGKRQKSVFGM
ncbi:hypothetical protein L7F22_034477 [Adiantum nelumboides]|nr:hypothetical protein [Adiantum nelumboides]